MNAQGAWLAPAAAVLAGALHAETVALKSPDGKNEIRLETGDTLQISVLRHGQVRIAPTPVSLTVEGKGVLGASPVVREKKERRISGTIQTPVYKKASIRDEGNEITVSFEGGYQVVLRADDDGVAYRFVTALDGNITVIDEQAGLNFPSPDLTAYVGYNAGDTGDPAQDKHQNSWESIYEKVKVSDIAPDRTRLVYLPLLLEYADGVSVCVTESDLLDYPGWNLYRKGAERAGLSAWLAQYPVSSTVVDNRRKRIVKDREPWIARTSGTRAFPWRVFIMADQPIKLVEADLVYKLASPTAIRDDFAWVKPGKVAWDWWNDWNVSGVDFRAGCNTETYKYYIDFAQKNGIEYVIFDEGWSVSLQIMEINPAVDVPGLIRYARERGVSIILWSSWPQLIGRQHEVFKKYAEMGAKGFKIDFMDRDDQFVVKYLAETAAIAAQYKLLVDYHGMFKPTGMHRTFPNIVNYEGVHGLEHTKWEDGTDFMAHDCKAVFTRMIAGPLDYTPGAMRNLTRKAFKANYTQPASQGTRVHQMALMTLFEAPLQMLCDSPTQYLRNQACTDFMSAVPTVWDETVGMAGEVGAYAAIARRKGEVWHLAAVGNWDPRELSLDLGFLKGTYRAEVFEDGINADRDPTDYRRSERTLEGGKPLTVKLAPGGGWTARLTPVK